MRGLIAVMEIRRGRLRRAESRNIETFNTNSYHKMPYIVVIVDEYGGLRQSGGKAAEEYIVRLAQQGRAFGIHVVLATQHPTVNVVTSHIKANVPNRIAFQVASQSDSRVILDAGGAESLLGRGNMLFLEMESSHPRRIQGTYLDDMELGRIVEF